METIEIVVDTIFNVRTVRKRVKRKKRRNRNRETDRKWNEESLK